MLEQRVEALVLRKHNAMRGRSLFEHATEMAGDMEVQGVAAVALDPLPFDPLAKSLSTRDEFDGNALLPRPDEDKNLEMLVQPGQIDLLDVLEID